MRTNPELLKVEPLYAFYSAIIRLFCPFCSYKSTHKTKCYHSLKSLGHHIATEHKDDRIYPFSVAQTQEIMKIIAKAMEFGILPYEQNCNPNHDLIFPKVKRFENES